MRVENKSFFAAFLLCETVERHLLVTFDTETRKNNKVFPDLTNQPVARVTFTIVTVFMLFHLKNH